MQFLLEKDYLPYIRTDNLNQIINNNDGLLEDMERVAILKIAQYTDSFFERECLFPSILNYDSNIAYNLGDYIIDENNNIYVADKDIIAPNLISDFRVHDPRNPLIIQWLVDFILYDLHSRISPNQVPTIRQTRFDNILSDLKNLAKGLYSGLGDECRRKDEDGNNLLLWGSRRKINNYW